MSAHLRFWYGSMSSGKSLNLLSTAYNLEENNIQIMVLKPSLDTRDGEGVIRSRAGLERKCIMIDEDVNLYKAIKAYRNFTFVLGMKIYKAVNISQLST